MRIMLFVVSLMLVIGGVASAQGLLFQTDFVRFTVEQDGRVSSIIEKNGYLQHLAPNAESRIAVLYKDNKAHYPSSLKKTKDSLVAVYKDLNITAELKVVECADYITIEAISVPRAEKYALIDITTKPSAPDNNALYFAAIGMNLNTNIPFLPGLGEKMQAYCVSCFGISGGKVAIIGAPRDKMRSVMKKVVYAAKDKMPHNPYGGPFAKDHKFNMGSYIVDCQQMLDEKVDDWLKICSETGIRQIDINNWNFFNGEYEVNPNVIPGGKAELKRVVDKLHANGIRVGLHTYSFLISRDSRKYVTPNPDPRILKGARFDLAADVDETASEIAIQTNADIQRLSADGARSIIIQVGNELITVGSVSESAPYRLLNCERGSLGTVASEHKQDAPAAELRQVYATFIPDVSTSLFKEIAGNIARAYNEFDLDMIYLDAIDAYNALDGTDNGWYWATVFVDEVVKKAKKPIILEGSTLWHGLWYARSRIGAWDVPKRAEKECYDAHFIDGLYYKDIQLPTHLGWCDIRNWYPVQPERTFPDDVEYLLCKGMAADAGISMQAYLNPDNYMKSELAQRTGKLIGKYEKLRAQDYFSDSIKQKLAMSNADYSLQSEGENWFFRPTDYAKHKVSFSQPDTTSWHLENKYAAQPVQLRIEALMSIDPYDSPEAAEPIALEDGFSKPEDITGIASSSFTTVTYPELGRSEPLRCFKAEANADLAWVSYTSKLRYGITRDEKGFGVWVYGDGAGEIINLQTSSYPSSTGYSDHYIKIDFNGWKYFELVEPESTEMSKYDWPAITKKSVWAYTADGPSKIEPRVSPAATSMTVYVMFGPLNYVTKLGLWYNNLPIGKEVTTYISPIKILPLRYAKITNPSVEIAGKRIVFPITIDSGQYIEFKSMQDCTLYDSTGNTIAQIVPTGEIPTAQQGGNRVSFSCETQDQLNPRLSITVITKGEKLQ